MLDNDSYHKFCFTKIKYIMHKVQDMSILYNNAVRPVICEGWHFTHEENIYMSASFHYRGDLAHKSRLTPPLLTGLPIPMHQSEQSFICFLFSLTRLYKEEHAQFLHCTIEEFQHTVCIHSHPHPLYHFIDAIFSGIYCILLNFRKALQSESKCLLGCPLPRHLDGAIFKNNFSSADNLLTRTLEVLLLIV